MSKPSKLFRTCALIALCLCAPPLFADALVKPLPRPDTSKLKPDQAKLLIGARAEFEKAKINLIGDALAQAYALIGAAYARAGFNDIAAIAFYDAAQLAPKDARWLYLRGVIAQEQKQHADARADFQAALALDQGYLPIRYRLADILIAQGDLDGAHKLLLDALPKNKNDAALNAMLGRLELKQKRYGDAIEHLQHALKVEPQANALYTDLATAYSGQGDAQLAAQARAKAGPTPPSLADPLVAGMYQSGPTLSGPPLQQARQLLAMHRFDQAHVKVDEALKANADDVEALALGARLDALLGRHDAAQKAAARALQLKPDSAAANLSQGMVYEFAGNDAQAYGFYQRAVQADPHQPDARLLLGNALMRRGEYAQAAEQYRQLGAIDPQSNSADAHMAAALVAAGRCSDALAGVNAQLSKRAHDGELMQVFVRLASTCKAATPEERNMALDYAQELYNQNSGPGNVTALALAQAAAGKFDDAQKSQAEAIYDAVRVGDTARAKMYREIMRQFAAKQVPDRAWPAQSIYFKPPLLTPLPPPATQVPTAK